MKIPLNFGGGDGSGSDECTATAEDVLESKTAIYDGSDDEAEYGTMKDYSGTSSSATAALDSSNSRVTLTFPNTGKYDTSAKLYSSYSNLASTISLTAAKIATGNTILGITGTYTGLGSATAAQVLSGKTFSTASLSNASGTMTDKSGTSTSATSSTSGSNVRLQIPANGYYNTSAYLTNSYSNLASTIGLTAAKIKYGESILGITGTAQGWTASSTDIYNHGTYGDLCGTSISSLSSSSDSSDVAAKSQTCCLVFYKSTSTSAISEAVYFPTKLNTANYSKLTVVYSIMKTDTTSSAKFIFGVTSNITNTTLFNNNFVASTSMDVSSTRYSATATVDISSVSSSSYVGFYCYFYGSSSFHVEILQVYVS